MWRHKFVLAACLSLGWVSAAPAGRFTFDENGSAFIGLSPDLQPGAEGELVKGGDPNHPDLSVLTYKLPFALPPAGTGGLAGDVLIEDMVGTSTVIGDLIRFFGNDTMVFYSDADVNEVPDDFFSDLADESGIDLNDRTIFPLQANHVPVLEGPGFRNDAIYTPLEGQPGFNLAGDTYRFISDTPEPSTLTMLGIGAIGLLGGARRARRPGRSEPPSRL